MFYTPRIVNVFLKNVEATSTVEIFNAFEIDAINYIDISINTLGMISEREILENVKTELSKSLEYYNINADELEYRLY